MRKGEGKTKGWGELQTEKLDNFGCYEGQIERQHFLWG